MEFVCRVCMQVGELMIHIFEEDEDSPSDLCTLLERCGGLVVDRNDAYPKYLCKECTSELLVAAKFRDKCERAQQMLSQMLIVEGDTKLDNYDIVKTEENIVNAVEESTNDGLSAIEMDGISEFLLLHDKPTYEETATEVENDDVMLSEATADEKVELFGEEEEDEENEQCSIDDNFIMEEPISIDTANDFIEVSYEEEQNEVPHIVEYSELPESDMVPPPQEEASGLKERIFKCDVCGAIFQQCGNLQKHMESTHIALHLYVCKNCDYCFSNEANYQQHIENCTETLSTSSADYVCSYCGKRSANAFALKMHLRIHTGERPFKCTQCEKSFKTQSALSMHMKRHIGKPDFACNICGKAFYETSNLRIHMRSHTGEKPHVCTVCEKGFSRVFLLQTHMRIHTGERPYECKYCERKFAQLCDVRSHEQIHTGDKPFKCDYCDKTFTKRYNLTQHMYRHLRGASNEAERSAIRKSLLGDEEGGGGVDYESSSNFSE